MRWPLLVLFICLTQLGIAQTIEEDQAGIFAPNFTYALQDGKQIALESLRGQVVYIAFWASWCKPCIQGFEKYRSIRNEMEEAGITLLNISIDSNKSAWENAIDKYNIQGIHGLADKSELMDSYQLYNVPRYEIVGKVGEFLYLDREGGKTVMDNFKAFLAQ